MNGQSIFIIGQGRSGKSGLATDFIEGKAPVPPMPEIKKEKLEQRWIIIAPSRTHPFLYGLDYISDAEPKEGTLSQKILEAYNQAKTHLLILCKTKNENLFSALSQEDENEEALFKGFNIYLDEAAIVTANMKDDFESFVRQVGQRDMLFVMSSHRIQGDISPVISLNVMWIFWVGPLMDEREIDRLYEKSNVTMKRDEFAERLYHQEKYMWWLTDKKARAENGQKSIAVIKTG